MHLHCNGAVLRKVNLEPSKGVELYFFKENYQPPAHVLLGKTSNLLHQNVHYLYKEEAM